MMAAKLCLCLLVVLVSGGTLRAHDQKQVPYEDHVEAEIVGFIPIGSQWALLPFDVDKGVGQPFVGKFTTRGILLVNLETLEFIGFNTLRDKSGDLIFINITGDRLTPTDDPFLFNIFVETQFIGGTGRFVGVRGGFKGSGLLMLPAGGSFVGATFIGDGVGTISEPKATKKKSKDDKIVHRN